MASRSMWRELMANGAKPRLFCFSFYPQNTDAPTIRSDPGKVVSSVARTAAGKFTITLRDRYRVVAAVNAFLTTEEDNRDMEAQGGALAPTAAGGATLVVKLKTGTANTDLAASGTDRYVSVWFFADDSARYS